MMERISIPESNVTGAAVFSFDDSLFVSLKNGSKAVILRSSDFESWSKKAEIRNYRDKSIPILGKVNGSFGVFASERYTPFFASIDHGEKIFIKTPFLKKAVVTGAPVRLKNTYLLPAVGIPYGCRLLSPVVFESEDGKNWFFKSFIALSENFGVELRTVELFPWRGVLFAFVCSYFPVPAVFVARSLNEGESWSKPQLTHIMGSYPYIEEKNGKLRLFCAFSDSILVYESLNGLDWDQKGSLSLGTKIIHMKGTKYKEHTILTVTYETEKADLIIVS